MQKHDSFLSLYMLIQEDLAYSSLGFAIILARTIIFKLLSLGTHTIGKGRCFSIMFRLYNQSGSGRPDPTINCKYKYYLDAQCPHGVDENVTLDLDVGSPAKFDNTYFKNLVLGQGLLNSDQVLFSTPGETRDLVYFFSQDEPAFFSALIDSMIKLGNLPPSSNNGEIRKNCRRVN